MSEREEIPPENSEVPPALPPRLPGSFKERIQGAEVLQAFFLFFLLSAAISLLVKQLVPTGDPGLVPWELGVAQLPLHLVIVASILLLRRWMGGPEGLSALGWTWNPNPLIGFARGLLWYIPMGFSWWTMAILYMVGLKALGMEPPKQEVLNFFLRPGVPLYGQLLLWIVTCATAPLAEELLFRGSLFSWLRYRFSFWPAALLTALAFALPHGGWKFIVPLGYLAIMLAWLRERSGSIWPAVGLHAAHNFVTLVLVVLFHPG